MKLYYFFTNETDTIKLKNLFEVSVPTGIELRPQLINDISFCKKDHGGGYLGWINKYQTIMKGFEETLENEYFIFSDIDIVFYKSFLSDISNITKNQEDILFQMETTSHDVNIGFMIIKNTEKSKLFWRTAFDIIEKIKYEDKNRCQKIKHRRGDGSGQFVINDMIYGENPIIKWSRLPPSFWSRSIGLQHLNKDIYVHHANCTYSIEQKINQIADVGARIGNATAIQSIKPLKEPVIPFGGASISKQEFDFILETLQKYNIKTVLEFGPGSSTHAFVKHNCKILSVENNKQFLDKNKQIFADYNDIEFFLNDQNNITILKNKINNQQFDLCFVDGPRADLQQYKLFNRIDSYVLASLYSKYILCHDSKRHKDRNSINLLFDPNIYHIEEFESSRGLTLIYKK